MSSNKVIIQTIFISKDQWEAGWPYLGYDNEIAKKSILEHITNKFPEIEFRSNEIITTYDEKLMETIKEDIRKADGIIIFTIGHYGDPGIVQAGIEIIESRKPVILANIIYMGDHTFTKIYTSIKDKNLPVYPTSSKNIEDFDKPIEVLYNLLRLKGEKILVHAIDSVKMDWKRITGLISPERKQIAKDHPELMDQVIKMSTEQSEFYIDLVGVDQAHQWRRDEKMYRENLKSIFGVDMIRGNPEETLKYYDEVDKEEAKKIAEKWKNGAKKVEPSDKTILNAAKLYIAFKKLLKEKEIKFFAPDCGTMLLCGMMPAYPCMPFFELTNEGMYGICESDMDCAISYLFGLYLTNRPGFVSNHTFDLSKNQITYMHCVAPNRVYGRDGPAAEYQIAYHGETGYLGASPIVKYPIGEPLTTIKISILKKKIEIRQGKIIGNIEDKRGCVTKVLVETNAQKTLENYDWETFGWHRVSFVGDWVNEFRIGAKLLGLKIVEP
ncbi:MAG: hypothetical protein ACP6IY_18305 [Promethearchaeia archaeon]